MLSRQLSVLLFTSCFSLCFSLGAAPLLALPPAEDIPEEVLRTDIITEARSPIDGEPLTAAEYAQLQDELQKNPELVDTLDPQIRHLIFLLQVRRSLRIFLPFIP